MLDLNRLRLMKPDAVLINTARGGIVDEQALICVLTNKQIAVELVVSPATVRSHVEHILAKLELRSRAQIAVWVSLHGLLSADASMT